MESEIAYRKLTVDDAPAIAAAMSQLARAGLKPLYPKKKFPELALAIAEEWAGVSIPDPPWDVTWVDLAVTGSQQFFANAIRHGDHCYDGAEEADYAAIVASIMALAGEEWPRAEVSATRVVRDGKYGPVEWMRIAIEGEGWATPFEIVADKNFDWSVVTRLNERLPVAATGRFSAFFDGNATIFYLTPDQRKKVEDLYGYAFFSHIDPLPEREPPPPPEDPALQKLPLPGWVWVIALLMGCYAAYGLIAMILRGAPYYIPDKDEIPVFFAKTPFEFLFSLTMLVVGTVLFLAMPLWLMIRRWRALARARRLAREGAGLEMQD